jgi:hypothetical protein
MKVAQYEVLGWRSETVARPGLSAIVRVPPSLFELRRTREEKAAPQRSDGGTKEGRDDRLAACGRETVCKRRGAKTVLSSLSGRAFLFASFPSPAAAGYWASTFIASLRDGHHLTNKVDVEFIKLLQSGNRRYRDRSFARANRAKNIAGVAGDNPKLHPE